MLTREQLQDAAPAALSSTIQAAHEELASQNMHLADTSATLAVRLEKARAEQHKLRAASAARRAELMLQRKATNVAKQRSDAQLDIAITSLDGERARTALLEAEKQRVLQAERDAKHRAEMLVAENKRLAQQAAAHAEVASKKEAEAKELRERLARSAARESASKKREASQRDEVHKLALQLQGEQQNIVKEENDKRRRAALSAMLRRQEAAAVKAREVGREMAAREAALRKNISITESRKSGGGSGGGKSQQSGGEKEKKKSGMKKAKSDGWLGPKGHVWRETESHRQRMKQRVADAEKAREAKEAAALAKEVEAEDPGLQPPMRRLGAAYTKSSYADDESLNPSGVLGGTPHAAPVAALPAQVEVTTVPMSSLVGLLRTYPHLEAEILNLAKREDLSESERMAAIRKAVRERGPAPPSSTCDADQKRAATAPTNPTVNEIRKAWNLGPATGPSIPAARSKPFDGAPLAACGSSTRLSPRPKASVHAPLQQPPMKTGNRYYAKEKPSPPRKGKPQVHGVKRPASARASLQTRERATPKSSGSPTKGLEYATSAGLIARGDGLAYPTAQEGGPQPPATARAPVPAVVPPPPPPVALPPSAASSGSMAPLVPLTPARESLQRSLQSDDTLHKSLSRIRELMGEAGCSYPTDLFPGVLQGTAAVGTAPTVEWV